MIKKILWLPVVAVCMSGCVSLKMPEVTGVSNLRLTDLSKDMSIQFDLGLKNPNSFGVTLKSMKTEILLADSVVASVGLRHKQRLAAGQKTQLPFTVKPDVLSMPKLGWLGITQYLRKTIKFAVKGRSKSGKFIFFKKYKFSYLNKSSYCGCHCYC
ncbi:MAG: LEA type 2 family protein [Bacteroidia bacterium]